MDNNLLLLVDNIEDGGAEKALIRLGNDLEGDFSNVYILPNYETCKTFENLTLINSELTKSDKITQKIASLYKYISVVREIKKSKKITHTISFLERSNIVNCLTKKDDLVLVSVRNNLILQYKKFGIVTRNIIRFLISLSYLRANNIISLSENVKNQLEIYLYFKKSVKTIYNGYDFNRIKDKAKGSDVIKKDKNKLNFMAIGRLTEQKGFDILINSFINLIKKHDNIELDIFGDGEEKEYLQSLIKSENLEEKIRINKPVKNIFPYLKNSDIFIFSSRWEGFGNALAEAIILDKVIVTTDCAYGPSEMLNFEHGIVDTFIKDSVVVYQNPATSLFPQQDCEQAISMAIENYESLTLAKGKLNKEFYKKFNSEKVLNDWKSILFKAEKNK